MGGAISCLKKPEGSRTRRLRPAAAGLRRAKQHLRRHGAPWPAESVLDCGAPAPLWFLPPGLPEHRLPPKEPP
jgi:hypothetical protein